MPVEIRRVVSEMFDQNCYLVRAAGADTVAVVDPGFDVPAVLEALTEDGVTPAAILLTHGHIDHIAGVYGVRKRYPAVPVIIGVADAPMLTDAALNLSEAFGVPLVSPPADRVVVEGDAVEAAGLTFDVLDLPGHSPGHVVYVVRGEPHLLGGDVLFQNGIGRTDFPGGSLDQLVTGIRTKLWPLPADTRVHPGHGPATTIGEEKRFNRMVGG